MSRFVAAAALQHRLGTPANLGRVAGWRADIARPGPEPLIGASNRTIRAVEPDEALRKRRARFRILLLRRAYNLACWLPEEAVLNLRRIDRDEQGAWVMLTLRSGTRLLDTGDRVTVRGLVDDVAIDELAECVDRRGWQRVEITGDAGFRMRLARELTLRGVEVVDCPLPAGERAQLRRLGGGFDRRSVGPSDGVEEPSVPLPAPGPPWMGRDA